MLKLQSSIPGLIKPSSNSPMKNSMMKSSWYVVSPQLLIPSAIGVNCPSRWGALLYIEQDRICIITYMHCEILKGFFSTFFLQKFPIIFHGVCGEDQQEARSPSFFNTAEISVLMYYLKKLLLENQGKKGQTKIPPKEIGVISPYRKQVRPSSVD